MRVLALTKYGREAASTRQRLLQFIPGLESAGFRIDVRPLLDDAYVRSLVNGASYSKARLLTAYRDRWRDLRRSSDYDALWIYAELFPGLPAVVEKAALRRSRRFIYDFDDAFFHAHARHPLLRDKLKPLIASATAVTAGNDYLADYAGQWNRNVQVIPTVVDTDDYLPPIARLSDVPVIGWIGSPSTWRYVRPVLPLLAGLCRDGEARFLAVGAGRAAESDRFEGMELRDWAEDREIKDVQAMDIGIMPLPDEPWARGKCGYKLIQYMACGLPVVASPVGVNEHIVEAGASGYLAISPGEWREALESLLVDPGKRRRYGARGRERVVRDFSLESQSARVVKLFREVAGR